MSYLETVKHEAVLEIWFPLRAVSQHAALFDTYRTILKAASPTMFPGDMDFRPKTMRDKAAYCYTIDLDKSELGQILEIASYASQILSGSGLPFSHTEGCWSRTERYVITE